MGHSLCWPYINGWGIDLSGARAFKKHSPSLELSNVHSSSVSGGDLKHLYKSFWNLIGIMGSWAGSHRAHLSSWVQGCCHSQKTLFAVVLPDLWLYNLLSLICNSLRALRRGRTYRYPFCGWVLHWHSISVYWLILSFCFKQSYLSPLVYHF